jgi:hypothetical protein
MCVCVSVGVGELVCVRVCLWSSVEDGNAEQSPALFDGYPG